MKAAATKMQAGTPIYLDYNATTPVDERVLAAMLPYFSETFGNAASRSHDFGRTAEKAVREAREQVAALIGAVEQEIIWTSGATESNNLAVRGAAEMYRDEGRHIITSEIEHKAVLDPCKRLEREGYEVTYLKPEAHGVIEVSQVAEAMRPDTILVSLMWANNEIGTINDVPAIGRVCKERGVLFHTDATQWLGKMPTDVEAAGVDLLSGSAHKMYGPKGVGCLYVRRRKPRVKLAPLMEGGGHERGMRSGTLNVPGIVGFGAAAELCRQEMGTNADRLERLRNRLEERVFASLEGVYINGDRVRRMPHVSNMSFAWVEGESLMMSFREVAISAGSACTSASLEPSYVLRSLGISDDLAHSSVRFSLGRPTTEAQIDYTAERVIAGVKRLREMSPIYELVREGIDPSTIDWRAIRGRPLIYHKE